MLRPKRIALMLCVTALVGALPAGAGAEPSSRTVTLEYDPNMIEVLPDNPPNTVGLAMTGNAKPRPGERFVMVTITDRTGRPVLAAAHQANAELGGPFCGETEGHQQLVSRKGVHVHLYAGEGCGSFSLPTQGTVTLTFHR